MPLPSCTKMARRRRQGTAVGRAPAQSEDTSGQLEAVHAVEQAVAAESVQEAAANAVLTPNHANLAIDGQNFAEVAADEVVDVATAADVAMEVDEELRGPAGSVSTSQAADEVPVGATGATSMGGGVTPNPLRMAKNVDKTKPWANLFKDNRNTAIRLDQFQHTGKPIHIDYRDIDAVEMVLGPCLVGCFMGHHSS